MKLLTFLFISLNFVNAAFAASQAEGIRIGNLQGADLSLMNNHDPENERQNLDLLPGYEINLFASEPMFANPIHSPSPANISELSNALLQQPCNMLFHPMSSHLH